MNSTEITKKLETLLQKATNPGSEDIDITALDGFCSTIQAETHVAIAATKLLANKIQSSNTNEALNALDVLEECMAKCGPEFQSEVGKFRFLNELIKLVSKKHRGDITPKIIRDKILDLLLIWTVQYSHETKIKEAYDMLRTQGVIHEPAQKVVVDHSQEQQQRNTTSTSRPPEDEISQNLRKLLQSKNQADLQKANLLIKYMVKEDEKKNQMKSLRLLELQKVRENVSVLNEMLDQYKENETSEDELNTINLLYNTCENLHPTILRLAQEIQDNEETIGEILEASDQLTEIFNKYKRVVLNNQASSNKINPNINRFTNKKIQEKPSAALLDLLNSSTSNPSPSISNEIKSIDTSLNNITSSNADLLSKLIDPDIVEIKSEILEPKPAYNLLSNEIHKQNDQNNLNDCWLRDPLKPTTASDNTNKNAVLPEKSSPVKNVQTNKIIPDLDNIVAGLLQSGLNPKICDEDLMLGSPSKTCNNISEVEDEKILSCDDEIISVEKNDNNKLEKTTVTEDIKPKSEFKSLAEIKIDLDKIKPSKEPPRIVLNDPHGLKVVLNFAEDHPRPDVSVIVISVINQGIEPISSFNFEASTCKFCRLHFLPPSSSALPGVKPFRPPAEDITQVLLFANQKKIKDVNMVCILSYCIGDDPDPIRESIEVKNLPYLFID